MSRGGCAALAWRILQILSLNGGVAPANDREALELYGLARFFGKRGHHGVARRYCESALELGLPVSVTPQAQLELARFVRRELRKTRPSRAKQTKPVSGLARGNGSALDSQMRGPARKQARA